MWWTSRLLSAEQTTHFIPSRSQTARFAANHSRLDPRSAPSPCRYAGLLRPFIRAACAASAHGLPQYCALGCFAVNAVPHCLQTLGARGSRRFTPARTDSSQRHFCEHVLARRTGLPQLRQTFVILATAWQAKTAINARPALPDGLGRIGRCATRHRPTLRTGAHHRQRYATPVSNLSL